MYYPWLQDVVISVRNSLTLEHKLWNIRNTKTTQKCGTVVWQWQQSHIYWTETIIYSQIILPKLKSPHKTPVCDQDLYSWWVETLYYSQIMVQSKWISYKKIHNTVLHQLMKSLRWPCHCCSENMSQCHTKRKVWSQLQTLCWHIVCIFLRWGLQEDGQWHTHMQDGRHLAQV